MRFYSASKTPTHQVDVISIAFVGAGSARVDHLLKPIESLPGARAAGHSRKCFLDGLYADPDYDQYQQIKVNVTYERINPLLVPLVKSRTMS